MAVVEIRTPRLRLRPFVAGDAPDIARMAGERDVAATTRFIPHPYELPMAETWIASLPALHERGELLNFAITLTETSELMGSISLILNQVDHHAELGYWIGKPYWNRGFGTEAAAAVIRHAFDHMQFRRVYAHYFRCNPASGRVLSKIGMKQEGIMREHRFKFGKYEDLVVMGMVKGDFRTGKNA